MSSSIIPSVGGSKPLTPRVAVIGAGAAGLVATRVLTRAGFHPTVLEKESTGIGGLWRYQQDRQTPKKEHAMYRNLRTNIPKEVMAYREFPFRFPTAKNPTSNSFVTHEAVLEYLLEYKEKFGLDPYIHYGCSVKELKPLSSPSAISPADGDDSWSQFQVSWENAQAELKSDVFDAVFICNGHFSVPSIPQIPGIHDNYRNRLMHAIEYDTPDEFKDQVVLCIGGKASGTDLAREISKVAKQVYLSDSSCEEMIQYDFDGGNVTSVPRTVRVLEDGAIHFDNDCPLQPQVDTIICCSGYEYSFPFIDPKQTVEGVSWDFRCIPGERRVSPLLKQLWHAHQPSLAFIGLPQGVATFPLFEFQVEAVVGQWKQSNIGEGDEEESESIPMSRAIRIQEAEQEATGGGVHQTGRIQDTHLLSTAQWDYCRQMAKLAHVYSPEVDTYIRVNSEMYTYATGVRKATPPGGPDSYRSVKFIRNGWDQWGVVEDVEAPKANNSDQSTKHHSFW